MDYRVGLHPVCEKYFFWFISFTHVLLYHSEKKRNESWTQKLDNILSERTLSDLNEGDTATILKVKGNTQLKKRLTEMGFKRGERIKVHQYAPLKDPIKISIKDYNLSLRVEEAKQIDVRYEESDATA